MGDCDFLRSLYFSSMTSRYNLLKCRAAVRESTTAGTQDSSHIPFHHSVESPALPLDLSLSNSKSRLAIKLDRLIVLSESSLLGWFLQVSLIVITKGRSPMEASLIVIIKQVSA